MTYPTMCPHCQCQSRTLSDDGRSVRCVRRTGHAGDHVNLLAAAPARIRWEDPAAPEALRPAPEEQP